MEAYVVLREEEYPTLLEELKKQLPASLMVYYPLMLSQENLLPKFKTICVDKWPEFTCVLEVENLADDVSPHRVNAYCRREECSVNLYSMICQLLQKTPSDILIYGGPRRMKEIISKSNDSNSSRISASGCCGSKSVRGTVPTDLLIHNAYRVSKDTLKKSEVPVHFSVTTIKKEHMDLILSKWPQSKIFSDAKEFFTHTATSLESVCILNESGEPVAWGFEQHYGAIGMIYVLKEYRRKKLGSAVVSILSEKILRKHDFVYAAIETENTESILLHKKLGYEKCDIYPECIFNWFFYEKEKKGTTKCCQ
ncbi:putative glycine N-acyltransferase-like protein 1B [Saccostrea cucullata]|uniref:putative glycine N-acyltransferase-like protein 1B n=1 Tax=Saccostrea cuccullata TaxID=36930 RepID=UPI002ED450A4